MFKGSLRIALARLNDATEANWGDSDLLAEASTNSLVAKRKKDHLQTQ